MIRHRYRRIVSFFARILIGIAIWDLVLPRLGLRRWAQRTRSKRLKRSAIAFRGLAIQMGGVLIKVGQFLSTRVDVLPVEITAELAGLQDEVPPERYEDIRALVEAEFGVPLEEMFQEFEVQPLAAASLGQVHRAWIPRSFSPIRADQSGPGLLDVVVKVQRPNIELLIATDLAALQTVGDWLRRYKPISRRADVPALLDEFTEILYEEIDYLVEGQNAETFAGNFSRDSGVRVPYVVWSHTTRRALTLENVWSIKITDYDEITAAGIVRAQVASRLLDTYLKQIFEDGFFHADPHPGNLFVSPLGGEENDAEISWQLTFIDFGMVGRVPPNTKLGLREMLIGVGTQDAARVVQSYRLLGVLLPSADLKLLEQAEKKAFDKFWGKNMSELQQVSVAEIHEFTEEFRELIYTMPFQIPQDFIFLARAVGILSGMCTGLDPNFNVWEHLAPYARKLISEEVRGGYEAWLAEIGELAKTMIRMPYKLDRVLVQIEKGEIQVRSPDVVKKIDHLESVTRQVLGGIIFAALLLAGTQLYLGGERVIAYLFAAGALLSLVWVMRIGRRR